MKSIVRHRGAGVSRLVGLVGAVALAGCSGAINTEEPPPQGGKPNEPGGKPPTGTPPGGMAMNPGGMMPAPTPVEMPGLSAAPSRLRRLTQHQYLNTVRDLLKMPDAAATIGNGLPADGSVAEIFPTNFESGVKGQDADAYADAAQALATKAVGNLAGLVPCAPAAGNAACAEQFISQFGRRAFRRPLTDAEVARYKKVFTAGGDFSNGIRLLIQTFLQSPNFLYLVEPVPAGSEGKILQLDSYSMASRLSYFLLGSMPDDQLLDAAGKGELATADQIGAQASRLLATGHFKETARLFHEHWLELGEVRGADKDPMLFPGWTDEVKQALYDQMLRFVEGVVGAPDGKLASIVSGTTTYLNGPLYDLYGLPKPAGANATTWNQVELDPKQRAGLLTQAGFMAGLAHEDRTSFILRGKVVREALLCTPIAPPPPGLNASETNIPATATAKERSERHRTEPSCRACHELFDPVGFAFEIYDSTGRFRANDATGKPIDSALKMNEKASYDGEYASAVDFLGKLGQSDELATCVTKQWLRFALGREVEDGTLGMAKSADVPSLNAGKKALKDGGGKISDLLVALARSDAFRHMKVLP